MPSAQPEPNQLCCASRAEGAPNRTALPADGAQRGILGLGGTRAVQPENGTKLSASSCCRETWKIQFLEAPSQVGVVFTRINAAPAQDIIPERRKTMKGMS